MSIQSNFPNLKPSLLLDFANTKQLDNRITFTRSTPAVYYDGKTTVMAEQNLYSGSQDFRTASGWSVQDGGQSVTTDSVTAPDGTTTADTLIEPSSGFNVPRWYQTKTITANTPYTISCYLKANTRTFGYVQLEIASVGNIIQYFNLSSGAISTLTNTGNTLNVSSTITSVGSGWYRCTLTATFGTGTTLVAFVGLADSTPRQDYTTNGSSLYAWGAQLEQRTSVTAYTATTTAPITNYIPVLLSAGGNQPRFDCNPTTGESLGLLIEEQRTNKAAYSSDFSNAYWQIDGGGTLISNQAVAPDGSLTADMVRESTSSAITPRLIKTSPWNDLSGSTFTFSIYAKSYGTKRNVFMLCQAGATAFYAHFDIVLGTIVQSSGNGGGVLAGASIENEGNGWFKISISGSIVSTDIYMMTSTEAVGSYGFGGGSYTGDGFSGVLYWGAQTEVGSFPTSYIATTSASATRTADTPIITGNNLTSWYSNNIGTIYASISVPSSLTVFSNSAATLFSMGSGRVTTRIINTGNAAAVLDQIGGLVSTSNSVTLNAENRTATSFSQGNYSICLNNGTVVSNTSTTIVQPATQLAIGFDAYDNRPNTSIKKIAYYPSVLTNAQLQALTS